MAYLITCSGSKKTPTTTRQSNLNNLYRDDILRPYRNALITQTGVALDWTKTLPAYELYTGDYSKIYRKISIRNWQKPCVEIKILSALFGWIRHTDLIPHYDLKMDEKKGNLTKKPYVFWKDSGVLLDMISNNDLDLLSDTYKKAFNVEIPANIPNGFRYTDWGDCVGKWLENELNNINCNG